MDTLPLEEEEDYSWLLRPTQNADADDTQKNVDAKDTQKNADAKDTQKNVDAKDTHQNVDAKDIPQKFSLLSRAWNNRKVVYENETDPSKIVARPNKKKRLRVTEADFKTWTSKRTGCPRRAWRWIDDPPSDLESDEAALFIE